MPLVGPFVLHFLPSYERPCLGRMGPASRAFVLQKLGFGWRRSGLRGRPANRRWGHSDWRVTWCEHMYCYYSIAAAVRPIPPTYTTRALRRCLWCQYNRRVRARSSVDRAPASGAGCGSSSLPGRTRIWLRDSNRALITKRLIAPLHASGRSMDVNMRQQTEEAFYAHDRRVYSELRAKGLAA